MAGSIRYINFSGFLSGKRRLNKLNDTKESSSISQRSGKYPKNKMEKMM